MTLEKSLRARLVGAALAVGALTLGLSAPALTSAPAQADTPETGTNVALASAGSTATASGQEVEGQWGPELVIDGNKNQEDGPAGSRWSSNTSDDAWIQVNLAEPVAVDHVTIYWEAACAAKYKLQTSEDGDTWTDATDEVEPVCGSVDRQELTTTEPVNHVRMQTIERTPIGGTKYGVSLWEFEVWDGPEPVPPMPEANLIPKPAYVDWAGDDAAPFTLTPESRILAGDDLAGEATLLAAVLRGSTGYELPIVTGTDEAGANDVVLMTGDLTDALSEAGLDDASLADQPLDDEIETYQLDVSAAGAIITGSSAHGVFNGTQTLLQLLPEFVYSPQAVDVTWAAPAVTIVDGPRYDYRAIMLDPARSFLTVEEVEHVIDALAAHKMSALHMHLADDQGWRIEITNEGKDADDPIDYTQLTEISGKTAMNKLGATYKDELGHTGYYTQEEYSDIVAYAAERHITVIPEIDLPGHTNAALHAIPQLNTAGSSHEGTDAQPTAPANGSGDVGYSYLDPDNPLSFTFIEHVLGQIADLTPGEYLHIGGDESHDMTSRYGIEIFNEFVKQTIDIVHDLGKKPIGWTEIAAGTLNEGDGVQYWIGNTADVERAVTQEGAKVLVSQGGNSYIDMKYHSKTPIGLTWACSGDCGFPRYYNWDPAKVIANVGDEGILGNEAPMWSETIRGGYQAEFLAFPRAFSHAEIGWSQQSDRDVADFTERMASTGVRLVSGGWNFYDGNETAWEYALAGTDIAAAPDRDIDFRVGQLAAPGTKSDGTSVAVDDVDDADSASNSALDGEFTATVDFGDGTEPQQVTFSTDQERDVLHASGMYTLRAQHAYAEAGTYTGTITGSEGTVATFTASIAEGTPDPVEPESPWDPDTTPSIAFTDDEAAAGDRTQVTIAGFEPGKHVELTFGGSATNSLVPGPDGTLTVYWQVPPGAVDGETTLEAVQDERTASDSIVVTDGRLALPNPIPQSEYSIADVSSEETAGEPAGSGVASAAIDGDPETYWHTKWQGGSDPLPHHITLDLGGAYDVEALEYTPRQANANGLIDEYEIYVSPDGESWGEPVASGSFADGRAPQVVLFEPTEGQYVRLVALSSKAGNEFVGAGELRVGGLAVDDNAGADDSGSADDSGTADDSGSADDSGAADDSGSADDSGTADDNGTADDGGASDDGGTADDGGAADDNGAADDGGATDAGSGSDATADGADTGAGGAAEGPDQADPTIPPVDPGMPDTGAAVLPVALIAGLVLVGGMALVLIRRRTTNG